jgi:hypothetical protein
VDITLSGRELEIAAPCLVLKESGRLRVGELTLV